MTDHRARSGTIDELRRSRTLGIMTLTREDLADGRLLRMIARACPELVTMSDEEREATRYDFLATHPAGRDLWVFGYGSLIWNPAIQAAEHRRARLDGHHRRFCVWAPVGRGTPERPGLVLGLMPGGACDGIAFRVTAADVESETRVLWLREMITGVYAPARLPVDTPSGPVECLAFVANVTNDRFVGDLDEQQTAAVIAAASGSMGRCRDYLDRTLHKLRDEGMDDPHLGDLQARIDAIDAANGASSPAPTANR